MECCSRDFGESGARGAFEELSQVTWPLKDRGGETGSGNRGWNEESTEGSGERYCLRKG